MSLTRLPLLALLGLPALWSCQQVNTLYDFDDDGSLDADDCQPSNPNVYPGAPDGYGDGIDQNCDGVDGNAVDQDGDNFTNALDCDDNEPTIYPGANDPLGDGIDQNCDGVDGVAVDLDGDGYSNAVDCNDEDQSIHPGALDTLGDGIDQNCDDQDGVAPPGDDDDSAGGNGFVAPENCADGFDNDQDGDIDCADPDCAAAALCLEDCSDGLDNDLDTAIDCADPDCAEAATCQEDCGDGLDNDLDGDTDCEDSNCESAPICVGGWLGTDGSILLSGLDTSGANTGDVLNFDGTGTSWASSGASAGLNCQEGQIMRWDSNLLEWVCSEDQLGFSKLDVYQVTGSSSSIPNIVYCNDANDILLTGSCHLHGASTVAVIHPGGPTYENAIPTGAIGWSATERSGWSCSSNGVPAHAFCINVR